MCETNRKKKMWQPSMAESTANSKQRERSSGVKDSTKQQRVGMCSQRAEHKRGRLELT